MLHLARNLDLQSIPTLDILNIFTHHDSFIINNFFVINCRELIRTYTYIDYSQKYPLTYKFNQC